VPVQELQTVLVCSEEEEEEEKRERTHLASTLKNQYSTIEAFEIMSIFKHIYKTLCLFLNLLELRVLI
jgi:hypothetical protein